jgi:hypothetical protein
MNYDIMSVDELAKLFIEKVKEKAELEEVKLKELNKEIATMDIVLTNKMVEKEIGNIEIDGIKLETTIDESFSIDTKNWDDERFHNWLKENKYDGILQTKTSIHPQTRIAFLKRLNEEGVVLPEFITITPWEHINYNKSEIKRRVTSEKE